MDCAHSRSSHLSWAINDVNRTFFPCTDTALNESLPEDEKDPIPPKVKLEVYGSSRVGNEAVALHLLRAGDINELMHEEAFCESFRLHPINDGIAIKGEDQETKFWPDETASSQDKCFGDYGSVSPIVRENASTAYSITTPVLFPAKLISFSFAAIMLVVVGLVLTLLIIVDGVVKFAVNACRNEARRYEQVLLCLKNILPRHHWLTLVE